MQPSSFTSSTAGLYAPTGEDDLQLIARDGPNPDPEDPPLAIAAVHGALLAFVDHSAYPCVGAKSAIHQQSYRLGFYNSLGTPEAITAATRDLQWFATTADEIDAHYATFLSVFDAPFPRSEKNFEKAMWKQLQGMHELDSSEHGWDPDVSPDPGDPGFSFSMGEHAFFIVGMHPTASRKARRFPYPTLVWNLHSQFERLREEGKFERMKETIRERDTKLQGTPNPELRDFGEGSEARQYSGCPHSANWQAPFEPVVEDSHGETDS